MVMKVGRSEEYWCGKVDDIGSKSIVNLDYPFSVGPGGIPAIFLAYDNSETYGIVLFFT